MKSQLDEINLKTIKPENTAVKRVKKYMQDVEKLQKLHSVKSMQIISFPTQHKIPFLSKIALHILRIQGGILDTRFEIIIKDKK